MNLEVWTSKGNENLLFQEDETYIQKILENADLITSFIEGVKNAAIERLQAGEKIPGFKLVKSTTRRAWDKAEIESIEKYLLRKLKQDGAYKRTLITPTQAVKALDGKSKKFVEKWIVKPEGRPIVAPETDKRPAINSIAEEFDDLS